MSAVVAMTAASASPDEVEVLPLGSGGEVGRSCVVMRYRGACVMFDCGNHPAKSGLDSLPFFDSIACEQVDVVLVTHFHLDHCGALPYFCNQTAFKGRVFMTSATKAFYKMVMNDFVHVGAGATDLVTNEWLQSTLERIETVEYHEEVTVKGIRFQPFNAGHVLGAAMFLVDVAGMRALYTGDFSRVPDRHLLGAEVPPCSPDILIVESTNGVRTLESREERELAFTSGVCDVVRRGGRCLVPVFALGRAQELLLILEEYWEAHAELQHVPIYYASSLAQRSMRLYQTFVSAMNDRVKEQHANHRNPFVFKFIRPLTDTRAFDDSGPCVVLASPGMLQSGLSLELFERWCGDRRNGIIMAGYCVDGTIAKDVLAKPREVTKPDGRVLPLRMGTIQAVSFSAHSDGRQTRDFIAQLPKVQHTVLVHGNPGAMSQLKSKLTNDFGERGMRVYTTANQEAIRIPFVLERAAKVMGRLAGTPVRAGEFVSGVMLVSAQHAYTLVHPDDVATFTELQTSRIQQAMVLPLPHYKSAIEVLEALQRYFAQSSMFDGVDPRVDDVDVDVDADAAGVAVPSGRGRGKPAQTAGGGEDDASRPAGRDKRSRHGVDDHDDDDAATTTTSTTTTTTRIVVAPDVCVEVRIRGLSQTTLTILWTSSYYNDLLADVTCIALCKLADGDPGDADDAGGAVLLPMDVAGHDRVFRVKCFHHMLAQYYARVTTNLVTGVCVVELNDGQVAQITDCIEVDMQASRHDDDNDDNDNTGKDTTMAAKARVAVRDADTTAEVQRLKAVLKRIYLTLFPIPVDHGWCDCGMPHDDDAAVVAATSAK